MGAKRSQIQENYIYPYIYYTQSWIRNHCIDKLYFSWKKFIFCPPKKLHKPTGKQPIFYVRNRYLKVHDVRAHLYC